MSIIDDIKVRHGISKEGTYFFEKVEDNAAKFDADIVTWKGYDGPWTDNGDGTYSYELKYFPDISSFTVSDKDCIKIAAEPDADPEPEYTTAEISDAVWDENFGNKTIEKIGKDSWIERPIPNEQRKWLISKGLLSR